MEAMTNDWSPQIDDRCNYCREIRVIGGGTKKKKCKPWATGTPGARRTRGGSTAILPFLVVVDFFSGTKPSDIILCRMHSNIVETRSRKSTSSQNAQLFTLTFVLGENTSILLKLIRIVRTSTLPGAPNMQVSQISIFCNLQWNDTRKK